MKTWRNDMLIVLLMLLLLAATTACGKKKSTTSTVTSTTPSSSPAPSSSPSPTTQEDIRICSLTITNLSVNALSAYMFSAVENIDGPATACLKLYGTGKYFDAALRIEYEDDFGVRSYNMVKEYTIFSEVSSNNSLRIIWLDNSGFVELKGSKQSNGKYLTTIKFSNLPTNSIVHTYGATFDTAYNNCHNGYYTVAQCLNWSQPVYYSGWGLNGGYYTESQMLTLVNEYLAGQHGSSAYTLGKVEFALSDVVVQ